MAKSVENIKPAKLNYVGRLHKAIASCNSLKEITNKKNIKMLSGCGSEAETSDL